MMAPKELINSELIRVNKSELIKKLPTEIEKGEYTSKQLSESRQKDKNLKIKSNM